MTDQQVNTSATAVADTPAPAAPTPPVKKPGKKKNKKVKRIIGITVAVVIVAVVAFLLWKFLFANSVKQGELLTDFAQISSIQSKVEGSGNARAKDSAAITLSAGGTVQEVYVSEGETVTAGQPLYTIDSSTAQEAVNTAQEALDNLVKDMNDLYEALNDLTITAPFSGKLMDVGTFEPGLDASAGAKVCTLVNDKILKLSLYYSYAYENDIYVGQSVQVSIPSVMGFRTGTVEKVNKVDFISPEGGTFFEVVITMDNPGTLTEGMSATASMTAADGSEIYPYENAALEYYEKREITVKAGGPILSSNLLNYANVTAGQTLLALGADDQESLIRAKQKEIDAAQEKVDEAQKALENFNAVAPIDGVVMSCTITPGQEVKNGDTVITISNTTAMVVEITVDDRNIGFVAPGMTVDLSDYNGNVYMGTVTNINMTPSSDGMSSGMTNYPVTLSVDNMSGTLLSGQWLQYSFVASQSDDCVVVPIQSVKSTSDDEGNEISVVFLRTDTRPENAVTMPEQPADQPKTYPTEAEGFYAVPVTTGLSDTYNVEIVEGLSEGAEVFTNYLTDNANSYGW